jgi:hypothetical protein
MKGGRFIRSERAAAPSADISECQWLGAAIETASMLLSSSTRRKSANPTGVVAALPAFF